MFLSRVTLEANIHYNRCALKCPRSLQVAPKMGVESVSVEWVRVSVGRCSVGVGGCSVDSVTVVCV